MTIFLLYGILKKTKKFITFQHQNHGHIFTDLKAVQEFYLMMILM